MINRQMQFLNHVRLCLRCFDANIIHVREFAILYARQTDDFHPFGVSCCCCIEDVFPVAARRNPKKNITCFAISIYLLDKAEQRFTVVHIS